MKKIIIIGLIFISCGKEANLEDIFSKKGIRGTILISSLKSGEEYVYNRKRAAKRFIPASTFKIINTLISLKEGAIRDEFEKIKWDGKERFYKEWNKDQTLESAFPISCVWFYQELARRVGMEKYKKYIGEMKYGNGKTGTEVDTFWLRGDIRISAHEQVSLLKDIYLEKYGFEKKHYQILKKIMVMEKTTTYVLRGKTGAATIDNSPLGWYVGWVETAEDTWFFACNIDFQKMTELKNRKIIVTESLKRLNIIN